METFCSLLQRKYQQGFSVDLKKYNWTNLTTQKKIIFLSKRETTNNVQTWLSSKDINMAEELNMSITLKRNWGIISGWKNEPFLRIFILLSHFTMAWFPNGQLGLSGNAFWVRAEFYLLTLFSFLSNERSNSGCYIIYKRMLSYLQIGAFVKCTSWMFWKDKIFLIKLVFNWH